MWDIVLLSVFVMYDDLLHIKYLLSILSLLEVLLPKGDFEISCWLPAKRKEEKVNYMQTLSINGAENLHLWYLEVKILLLLVECGQKIS